MDLRRMLLPFAIVGWVIASPGQVSGATKSPPVTKVSSSLIRSIKGTSCAYLPTTSKTSDLRNVWTAGTRKGPTGFIAHSSAAAFYKSKGSRYRAAYRRALADSKSGAVNCRRLTALKFRTSGIVGAALAKTSSTKKSSVHGASASKVAIAGLYGITSSGKISALITAISPKDEAAVRATAISRVYQAPDGALVLHYSSHPNSCVIGKIPVGADSETCLVLRSDLPKGSRVEDAGGYVSDNTELVQFDQVGGIYLNISVEAPNIGCGSEFKGVVTETVFVAHTDGTRETMVPSPSPCQTIIMTWATLDTGGVVYAQGSWSGAGTVNVWTGGTTHVLKSGLVLTPNGLHSLPDGKIAIFVHEFASGFDLPVTGSQGGVLLYDPATGSVVNWLHLGSNHPEHATENVFAACGCTAGTLYASGGVSNGDQLFGVTTGSITTPSQTYGGMPSTQTFPIAVRLFPTVAMLAQLPSGYTRVKNATLSTASERSMVVAGPEYLTCTVAPTPIPCTYQMGIVDFSDNSYTQVVAPSDGIATLTLSAQVDGDLVLTQSIRQSDGRYLIGVIDQSSRTISWSETSTLRYRFITALTKK